MRRGRRAGFTLLEVVLALAVGVVLLSGLYIALSTFLAQAESGRQLVQQSATARTLLSRMASDITSHLAPVPPSAVPTEGEAAEMPAESEGEPESGETNESSEETTTSTAITSLGTLFNLGVQGDAQRLVLTVSRPPPSTAAGPVSDLRRITYWLVGPADNPLGLARQEITEVTSDDAPVPPDVPDEASHIIAAHVRSVLFEYFDGTSWVESWNGNEVGADGKTPIGPPAAIAITITVARPGAAAGTPTERLTEYRHVVAIPTANRLTQ